MSTSSRHYDVVVVGSGFGGATTAYKLAMAGARVALIERGGWVERDAEDWDARSILLARRYRGESPVQVSLYGGERPSEYPNETVGGASIFYGGASLRLRESDFDRWPIDYDTLAPHYDEAERLLGIHGSSGLDPHEPSRSAAYPFEPIPPTGPAERIQDAARTLGYTPFPIPLAINFADDAREQCILCTTCDGYPCRIEAKNDLTTTVLKGAQEVGLEIIANCVAGRFVWTGSCIQSLSCVDRSSGSEISFTADTFVLGAGALSSPTLLLRSGIVHPFIGRFLMRHCNVIVTCVFPYQTNPERTFHKQTCLTDFYEQQRSDTRASVGVIQDIYTPDPVVMKAHAPVWGKWVIGLTHRYMQNLLCVAEDDPREENTVTLAGEKDPFGLEVARVTHDYTDADRSRSNVLTQGAKAILQEAGGRFPHRYLIDTFSHGVGSVRMGMSADDSALDTTCKLHQMDNLYVSDGCFIPTSGGVNPSLTIAANGLRVGEHLVRARG